MPSMCSRISSHGSQRVSAPQQLDQPPVLLVRVQQHLRRMGDYRDQVAHLTLHLGHLADQAGRSGGLGDADVKADVGAPVLLEPARVRDLGHQLDEPVEAVELRRLGAFGGQ